ncbi:UDP-N-acetylmuramoyl-L-alanine--D-glutamate ligase [Xanthomonas campestris pv. campestris]|uniref:UDP-N-acetylmuramoyl-L-alanine--D-glutamate ligase n=1 Tax=Xanthomonas campestris TaxID=339 RepID=UPI001A172411|nr:UDP-N-acetylmuramoyl-L-alanine--D-glutamate ligase [Xanthomonas campestris]MBF9174039.1 UDP-N-acetylmuramoyl-L-alanine--D-glutamate ligase [Xanthomonas campestris pv. campestris]MDO0844626.1 UDP-N-acetylmuramoyl-L-alanine--D-glutamate ligase [Xanthomonas campestris pv. campestris]MDO0862996.1 UDP-N-acetylmuramoyl-L-alanine--D-glutamate ligase [Xanthomonas campestris pv. campestris]MEB1202443.1 UDP-N-acetylmuramoyl-L-alanine--D-glutamate ligase [Xanthomonas campestris pv. campestris]MEB12384
MRISQLEGKAVALWGWAREGRAAYCALRQQLPTQALTVFCNAEEARDVAALADPALQVQIEASAQALAAFEVVIKSPGISPYREEARAAAAQGTRFIGGTALWFAEHAQPDGYVPGAICVTGTKGKSTTTALLAHLLRAGGHRTALVGNIGQPLLEVLSPQPPPAYWAIELSSYQTGEVGRSGARPELALVLNLFPEHLDWHGSEAAYVRDKLALVTDGRPRIALLNAADPHLAQLQLPESEVRWFNHPDGWHLRGDVVYRGQQPIFDTAKVPLPGEHNRRNLCAVLAAVEALGLDAAALAPAALTFRPLPNRLQWLGSVDGIAYVNDSISTTPHASLAALACFAQQRVALLVGGHDRGLDWQDFAAHMAQQAPLEIVTMGANGPRIHALLAPLAQSAGFGLHAADDLAHAMQLARSALGAQGGVVLLSPGAPSFGVYSDYVARGRHFAQLAGFDPAAISAIPGLGVQ